MKRFIVLTFLLMGWGYYELSGGSGFVPESRPVEVAATPAAEPADLGGIDIVTRADSATLAALTEPQGPAETLSLAVPTESLAAAVPAESLAAAVPADDIAAALQQIAPVQAAVPIQVLAPIPSQDVPVEVVPADPVAPALDLREVTGDRVNLREGPGRDFAAVDQLSQGTVIQVIATGDSGWVQIEVTATGLTGWMSADFLTAIDG